MEIILYLIIYLLWLLLGILLFRFDILLFKLNRISFIFDLDRFALLRIESIDLLLFMSFLLGSVNWIMYYSIYFKIV